ncbi:MAG TPA: diguanylate cyclase [Blastococcus sp.]|nr:diguanylate cyclase [Blastococcus sp.]
MAAQGRQWAQPPGDDDGLPGPDEELLRDFVAAIETMIFIADGSGRILLTNPALQAFTGRTADDLLGRPFWDVFVAPEHRLLAQDAVERAMDSGRSFPQEGDWLTADGTRRRVTIRTTVLADPAGRPYAVGCIGLDVTADRRREEQLHHRAQTDLLTGIANRAALFDALRRCLDAGVGPGCALLFCDLDQFKRVNDDHGHAVGDRLLTEVALRLVEVAGPDDVVARFGGDEFVILCPQPDEAELGTLTHRLVTRVEAPFPGPEGPLYIGVSVGVAIGRPGETADDLIGRADRAMYGVKTHHRRRTSRPAPSSSPVPPSRPPVGPSSR